MTIDSRATPEFWRLYRSLPADTRQLARKAYQLWSANAHHPSLCFKPIAAGNWSVRIGGHYRAVGRFMGETFLWEWIGTHESYNKKF